jgi:alpha-mannosidase
VNSNTKTRLSRTLAGANSQTVSRLLRRAEVQLSFANTFATLLPERAEAEGWHNLLTEAKHLLESLDSSATVEKLQEAITQAEMVLQPLGKAAKEYRVHCVGHGHIDMNWMWSWQETTSTTFDTFQSVLNLMREYPELTYSQSQASVYALVEKYFPAMFREIQERVKEGRWEITAVHWVEGDKNISSAESLCRHILYTRRYIAAKFGLEPEDVPLDWEPDTFGHANTTPTVLAQAGVKFYYSCRTGGGFDHAVVGQFPRPRLFWWQGPDGSRILVNRESTWYNSYVNIGENIALPAVEFWRETGLQDWLNIYGIGNHGGGPTRTEIEYYQELGTYPIYPQVVFSTAKAWYETVATTLPDSLPVLDHELNFEFTGCYTSQSLITQANRFGENYLVEAETLEVIAEALTPLPRRAGGGEQGGRGSLLREGWINILFNQFHDILPGSGVRQTREHAMGLFQETGAITGAIKRTAGLAITSGLDTLALLPESFEAEAEKAVQAEGHGNPAFEAGAGIRAMESGFSIASGGGKRFKPFVVYNPCAWTRSEPVTVTIYDSDLEPGRLVARDETGAQHPTLFLGHGNDWGHHKLTVMFLAHDIPPLGYRTFVLCEGVPTAETPMARAISDTEFITPYLKLKYDRYHCGFQDVIDAQTGTRYDFPVSMQPFGEWQYVTESPRGMTAWVLGGEVDAVPLKSLGYHVVGAIRNGGTGRFDNASIAFRIDQHLEVPGTSSTVRLSSLIHALEPRIDVTAEIDWREIGDPKRGIPGLLTVFPLNLEEDSLRTVYETPFGSVERRLTNTEEVPTLRYAHVTGQTARELRSRASVPWGFTLLQDCKYGHSVDYTTLRLRMIRSSFDPDHAPEVCRQTVRYSMVFHEREADPATLTRLGAAWNHPLIVFPANVQSGERPTKDSFVRLFPLTPSTDRNGVVVSAVKRAEEGNGLIVRVMELNGQDTEAVLELHPLLVGGYSRASIVDLMERPATGTIAEGRSATLTGNQLTVQVPAKSFVTVRLD